MNEQERKSYLEQYHQAKEKGVPFFPDILFKDALISLLIFLALIGLALFVGAPLEARADPSDTSYTPRPEWYFIFLFQLLKYFPPNLEVIGVVVIPTLGILLLFLLPLLDRSPRRHYLNRPVVMGVTLLAVGGMVFLTAQAYREAPPPQEADQGGDMVAALYTKNCAGCHGASISVDPGANLHDIIAQGQHEGMPAWSADLTNDQIDALAGFILSPGGSQLFSQNCADCHEVTDLIAGDPLKLKQALEQDLSFTAHADLTLPNWSETLGKSDRTRLINFLIAPDGQRLFEIYCASCHGQAVANIGEEDELRVLISQGGLHLTMPPWSEKLSEAQIDTLAGYIRDPNSSPEGDSLFQQNCSTCHGNRIPTMEDIAEAKEMITQGGAHETMPVWGDLLTQEQLDALVSYTLDAARGTSLELGQEIFATNCASCHGDFGEGGPNPTRPGDIIAPISTDEYLKTRDDFTLRSIIAQGQPNFGMSPFGLSFGGPLDESEIDAIVAYLRSLEVNPPVEQPTEIASEPISLKGAEIYTGLCAQCHGSNGEGGVGPALADPGFQTTNSEEEIFNTINLGHKATPMIAWGEILTAEQIQELVKYILQFTPLDQPTPTPPPASFTAVEEIFEVNCNICHGTQGGWDGTSYDSVINSGDNGPAVIPGDVENSLLAQKLLGTQTIGDKMPPFTDLTAAEIQLILDWIASGAPDN